MASVDAGIRAISLARVSEDLDNFSDDEIMTLADNLKKGVPFATTVFDGAHESEILRMLDLAYPEPIAKKLGMTP